MPTTTDRITKTPGVCGGDACIRGHRIPVWSLVAYRQLGLSDAQILEAIEGISMDDLQAAWRYYEANRAEIERAIAENEEGEEGLVE